MLFKLKLMSAFSLVVLGFTQMSAQDNQQTIFKSGSIKSIQFSIAPEFQYGQLSKSATSFGGASFNVSFNGKFNIGVGFQQSLNTNFSPSNLSGYLLSSSITGVKMEYVLKPNSAIHVSFPLTIARGSASTIPDNGGFGRQRPDFNSYFVIQPGVQVELNLFKGLKAYTGVNYRFSKGNINNTLNTDILQGLVSSTGLKFQLKNKTISK